MSESSSHQRKATSEDVKSLKPGRRRHRSRSHSRRTRKGRQAGAADSCESSPSSSSASSASLSSSPALSPLRSSSSLSSSSLSSLQHEFSSLCSSIRSLSHARNDLLRQLNLLHAQRKYAPLLKDVKIKHQRQIIRKAFGIPPQDGVDEDEDGVGEEETEENLLLESAASASTTRRPPSNKPLRPSEHGLNLLHYRTLLYAGMLEESDLTFLLDEARVDAERAESEWCRAKHPMQEEIHRLEQEAAEREQRIKEEQKTIGNMLVQLSAPRPRPGEAGHLMSTDSYTPAALINTIEEQLQSIGQDLDRLDGGEQVSNTQTALYTSSKQHEQLISVATNPCCSRCSQPFSSFDVATGEDERPSTHRSTSRALSTSFTSKPTHSRPQTALTYQRVSASPKSDVVPRISVSRPSSSLPRPLTASTTTSTRPCTSTTKSSRTSTQSEWDMLERLACIAKDRLSASTPKGNKRCSGSMRSSRGSMDVPSMPAADSSAPYQRQKPPHYLFTRQPSNELDPRSKIVRPQSAMVLPNSPTTGFNGLQRPVSSGMDGRPRTSPSASPFASDCRPTSAYSIFSPTQHVTHSRPTTATATATATQQRPVPISATATDVAHQIREGLLARQRASEPTCNVFVAWPWGAHVCRTCKEEMEKEVEANASSRPSTASAHGEEEKMPSASSQPTIVPLFAPDQTSIHFIDRARQKAACEATAATSAERNTGTQQQHHDGKESKRQSAPLSHLAMKHHSRPSSSMRPFSAMRIGDLAPPPPPLYKGFSHGQLSASTRRPISALLPSTTNPPHHSYSSAYGSRPSTSGSLPASTSSPFHSRSPSKRNSNHRLQPVQHPHPVPS